MGGYYLENLYKADPNHPVRQALSTRHNFRVIIEKLNATMTVVNNLVIRNNIVYTYIESVDATHPFEMDFYIPTVTDAIKKISLTLKGVPFRSYAKSAASGGGDTSGSSITTGGFSYANIVSGFWKNTPLEHPCGIFNYETCLALIGHTHTTPNHTHNITHGIYESTTPTAVNGYYDDGEGYSAADSYGNAPDGDTPWNIKTEYDITNKYSGTGWKRLKLDTSRLGRFNTILMVEVDLTPTT